MVRSERRHRCASTMMPMSAAVMSMSATAVMPVSIPVGRMSLVMIITAVIGAVVIIAASIMRMAAKINPEGSDT